MKTQFGGKNVVITGAGRGIARQVAIDFANDGGRVAVVDLVPDRAQAVVKEILAVGGAAVPRGCGIRDEASVRAMVREVMGACKRIDVLVNAAGGYTLGRKTHEMTEADWDLVVDSNLKGTFLCCKHVLVPMMDAGGGRIINFSPNAGPTSSPALGCHYTAAKAGVLGLTRHLAKEYASHKILVNTVAPGPARVERNSETRGEEARARLLADMPLGRFAEPSDLSSVVRFLASDGGSF